MPSHYKVSYGINIYYHIYVSANIDADGSIDIINSARCLRFFRNEQGELEDKEDIFDIHELNKKNGIASIFMNSDQAPMNNPCIYHVYINGGDDQDAKNVMIDFLNGLNEAENPVIIKL